MNAMRSASFDRLRMRSAAARLALILNRAKDDRLRLRRALAASGRGSRRRRRLHHQAAGDFAVDIDQHAQPLGRGLCDHPHGMVEDEYRQVEDVLLDRFRQRIVIR